MTQGYEKSTILQKLDKALEKIDTLYTKKFINYKGCTLDSKEPYTEIIAGALLTQLEKFENIKHIDRKNSYKIESHNGKTKNDKSNRNEERFAHDLFKTQKEYDHIGRIIDYQIPIKNIKDDEAGKIDLLSYNNNELILLELKVDGNKDTLLRCVLEIVTYWHQINHDKLYEDFEYTSNNKKAKKAILVPLLSVQHEEYKNKNTNIRKLMIKLDVDFYLFECKNDTINILRHHEDSF